MFTVGNQYTKKDLYKMLKVPLERQKGAWDTGYREYEEEIFIFSNVGIPGRTGHDYNNYWDGDLFVWEGKTKSNFKQPLIQKMLHPSKPESIHLFTRISDKNPFTYEGTVIVKEFKDTIPVKIVWGFDKNPYDIFEEEEAIKSGEAEIFYEGALTNVRINKYERNPLARRMCIEHYGCFCNVCKFDFFLRYGDWGKNYIHVHHLIPIASVKEEYILNPENDLIPICPNCHSMIHRKKQMITIEDLKALINFHYG